MENLKSFEDLKCWQACRDLRVFVKQENVTQLPADEKFRLIDQIIRSSRSSTANIAEGYGRFHYLDNAKFCSNARGSCWETLDHLITANDDNLINNDLLEQGRSKVSEAIKILNGYISYLQRSSKKS